MDSDDRKLSQLSAAVPISTDIILFTSLPATSPTSKKTVYDNGGWIGGIGTWSYSSADAPTFVISINADVTGYIGVGMRIKLTQTTDKYFIVTAVGAYSGSATLVTVYGGTDYTLANAAITSPYYSQVKIPYGFPADPDKWTVSLSNTTSYSSTTNTSTYQQLNAALTIVAPIGKWLVSYSINANSAKAAGGTLQPLIALSTSTSSASDNAMVRGVGAASLTTLSYITTMSNYLLSVASKTSYYIIIKNNSVTVDSINIYGSVFTTSVKMVCTYL